MRESLSTSPGMTSSGLAQPQKDELKGELVPRTAASTARGQPVQQNKSSAGIQAPSAQG